MPAYVLIDVDVHDPAAYEAYKSLGDTDGASGRASPGHLRPMSEDRRASRGLR